MMGCDTGEAVDNVAQNFLGDVDQDQLLYWNKPSKDTF